MSSANPYLSPTSASPNEHGLHRGSSTTQTAVFFGLIAAGVATRLLPHPENLTAIGAVALFGGAYYRRSLIAVLVPILALLVSDLVLSITWAGTDFQNWHFLSPVHYALFGLTAMIGLALRNRPTTGRFLGATIAATVMYYLVSNLTEWFQPASGIRLYPQTFAGLIECYIAGLPFVRNMLIGNLLYGAVLFGGWRVAQQLGTQPKLAPAKATA